jgi:hypothetical protein
MLAGLADTGLIAALLQVFSQQFCNAAMFVSFPLHQLLWLSER